MSKYLRWQGIAGFIVTLLLLVAITLLFAPMVVKTSLEKGLTWYLGAEVNVADVDLNWQPLQIDIYGFQATDNQKPSHNLIQFSQAKMSLDVWQYLFGKVLIEDLSINGLAFNLARATVGEVYRQPEQSLMGKAGEDIAAAMPSFEQQLPNIEDLLNDSNLITVKAAEQLQLSYQQELLNVQSLQQQLPSQAELEQYKLQVDELSKTKIQSLEDVTKLQKDLDTLKTKFKEDQALVAKSQQQLQKSKQALMQATTDLRDAPLKDWDNIEQTYQLDKIDNADFAHMLFGEDARQYYQVLEQMYLRLQPLVDKGSSVENTPTIERSEQGEFVYFKDAKPLPPWLVKHAMIEILMAQGRFELEISELTGEHWHRNKATEINVSSDNVFTTGSGKLSASIFNSHGQAANVNTNNSDEQLILKGDWQLNQVPVTDANLRQNESLSLAISSANVNGVGQFSLIDNAIHSLNEFSIAQAQYQGVASSSLGNSLISALQDVDAFALTVTVDGQLKKPDYAIDSDLNGVISAAVSKQLQLKLQDFRQDFSTGLNSKVTAAIDSNKDQNEDFLSVESVLTDTDNALNKLLEANVGEDKKQQLEDKLKKKLGDLFG